MMRCTICKTWRLVVLALLVSATSLVRGNCRFPQFVQRGHPWVGDYRDRRMTAYFKQNLITLIESNVNSERDCLQRVSDNKYVVIHRQSNQLPTTMCMQFLQRGENVLQIKTSDKFEKQTSDICDESKMEIDPFPLVFSGHTPENRVSCPFTGGYNMYVYYPHPNNSIVCNNLMILMRLESECDRGDGITLDFRSEVCIPNGLPRGVKQKVHCVAHWIQESYTFILMQHDEVSTQWFCLRTSDPLSNIQTAYLWLKVICDHQDPPKSIITQSYVRLELTKQIFSSTCADELELCQEMPHYCTMEHKRHCARTCGLCKSENHIGECTFDEQFRGRWVESSRHSDNIFDFEVYTLHSGQLGKYSCLNLDNQVMPEKRVLLELFSNGCFPRYTCIEMSKITSSVMKFRQGDRLTWPLASMNRQKEEICSSEHFREHDRHSHQYRSERPGRLLVNVDNIREVNCGLPARLQKGIAFREDGKHCGGCLNYDQHLYPNHFIVRPVNCSSDTSESKGYLNIGPIQYSCLASFQFYNNTYSVVTKTASFAVGIGQYLVWIFTPENHIKVMKAADTYLFEHNRILDSSMLQAQFSILRNDNLQCRNHMLLPRSTTTTTHTPRRFPPHRNYENESVFYPPGTTHSGIEHLTYNPRNDHNSQLRPHTNPPRYDNSKGENIMGTNSKPKHSALFLNSLLCLVLVATVTAHMVRTDHVTYIHSLT